MTDPNHDHLGYATDKDGTPWATCMSCGMSFEARYTKGALLVEVEGYVMVLGMDRPVHKCPDMPKWVEAYAIQEAARLTTTTPALPEYGPVLRPRDMWKPMAFDIPVHNMEMIRALA